MDAMGRACLKRIEIKT